jgi:hypothetical protein
MSEDRPLSRITTVVFRMEEMEETVSSETLILIYQNIRSHIPESHSFNFHLRDNVKFYIGKKNIWTYAG